MDSAILIGMFRLVDITDADALAAAVADVLGTHGRIDVLGNLAGINDVRRAACREVCSAAAEDQIISSEPFQAGRLFRHLGNDYAFRASSSRRARRPAVQPRRRPPRATLHGS